MSGGGGGGTTTTTTEPPAYLKPYLQDAANLAYQGFHGQPMAGMGVGQTQNLLTSDTGIGGAPKSRLNNIYDPLWNRQAAQTTPAQGAGATATPPLPDGTNFSWPEYYPNSTVVPFSTETSQALDLQAQRALAGSPLTSAAQNEMTRTINGDYLTGGAGFDAAYQAAANRIIPQVASTFGVAGRGGSGLAQAALGQGLSDSFAGLYNDERQRQLQASAMAPSLAAQDYADIGQLANVGAAREGLAQNQLQDQINRFNYNEQLPYTMLNNYISMLNGQPGGFGTTTATAPGAGMAQNLIGGGLLGLGAAQSAGVGSIFGGVGPPMSAAMTAGAFAPWALGGAALMGLLG